jgi:hypothetical protein
MVYSQEDTRTLKEKKRKKKGNQKMLEAARHEKKKKEEGKISLWPIVGPLLFGPLLAQFQA